MGDRKARLAALAAKAGRTEKVANPDPENDEKGNPASQPLSFRNYAPNDESLAKRGPSDDNEDEGVSKRQRVDQENAPSALEDALQEAKVQVAASSQAGVTPASGEIGDMAPKKINWDLKRDIKDKLARLERRTQKAIVEMLKERLEREASEQANSDDSDLD